MHREDTTVDYIDPRKSDYVCGLDVEANITTAELGYNAIKTNRFIPYRVKGFSLPPRVFGDFCEFLIEGEWVFCEFRGGLWWEESKRIGCGCTKNRVFHPEPGIKGKLKKFSDQISRRFTGQDW